MAKRKLHHIYELDVALGTGMRRGEQYGLTWDDVSFSRKEITLAITKNGSGRIVHLIDDVVEALEGLKKIPMVRKSRNSEETKRPDPRPANAVFSLCDNKKWWASATGRAKIKKLRWHDLTHTFCSRLAQSGASLKIIQKAAGHKTIQMAARYSHLDSLTLRTAMTVLNRPRVAASRAIEATTIPSKRPRKIPSQSAEKGIG